MLLTTFDRRSREDGAKAVRRFGEPRIYVIGKLLVIGQVARYRYDRYGRCNCAKPTDRSRTDRCRLNAARKQVRGEVQEALCCSSRYAFRNFQHSSKEISKPLNRGIPHDRILGEGKSLFQTRDRAREIGSQRLRLCHSEMRCCATLRNFSGTHAKSTTSIV